MLALELELLLLALLLLILPPAAAPRPFSFTAKLAPPPLARARRTRSMRCSMVSTVEKRFTTTVRVWPMRCTRFTACSSVAAFGAVFAWMID